MISARSARLASFLAVVTIALASISKADTICGSGEIGLGVVTENINVLGAREMRAVIIDDSCVIIDGKGGADDTNICGTYTGGSSVVCGAGTETPDSVETFDGKDYTECMPSTVTCSNSTNGNINGDIAVGFCCLRQFPP